MLPFSDRLIAEPGAKKVEDVYEPNPNEINATSVFRQLEFVTPFGKLNFFHKEMTNSAGSKVLQYAHLLFDESPARSLRCLYTYMRIIFSAGSE